ncbi:Hypothetical protein FKW44_006628 [Caligus rogercresseyi]|uniref:Uncharacterized protein n=1 Tax=Caligus rogercresseyi TaxID=217165 RepID=A0A7T8KDQ3_CALRO|nr:Hypothetical protein FKW44_006628 [Caligus rogercresseyi]
MGEYFVSIPNILQRSKGGLRMIDVDIHCSLHLISWLKRYPMVDHLWRNALSGAKICPVQHWVRARTRVPPTPAPQPRKELWDFPQELLEA